MEHEKKILHKTVEVNVPQNSSSVFLHLNPDSEYICCTVQLETLLDFRSNFVPDFIGSREMYREEWMLYKHTTARNFTWDVCKVYLHFSAVACQYSNTEYNFNILIHRRWFPILGYDFSMNKLCYLCHFHNMEMYLLSNHNLVTRGFFCFLRAQFFFSCWFKCFGSDNWIYFSSFTIFKFFMFIIWRERLWCRMIKSF